LAVVVSDDDFFERLVVVFEVVSLDSRSRLLVGFEELASAEVAWGAAFSFAFRATV
jgi:hypothetical protein